MATDELENITTNEVKAYHGISASDTGNDAKIDVVRPLIVDLIQDYCRHDFKVHTYTEYPYIKPRRYEFYLDHRPVTSITSLVEDGQTLTENTHYYVDYDTGRVERISSNLAVFNAGYEFGYWTTERRAIVVTYTAGETLTMDVVLAFYELCGIYAGIKTKTFTNFEGIEQAVTLTSIPKNIMEILERHKYYRV